MEQPTDKSLRGLRPLVWVVTHFLVKKTASKISGKI